MARRRGPNQKLDQEGWISASNSSPEMKPFSTLGSSGGMFGCTGVEAAARPGFGSSMVKECGRNGCKWEDASRRCCLKGVNELVAEEISNAARR